MWLPGFVSMRMETGFPEMPEATTQRTNLLVRNGIPENRAFMESGTLLVKHAGFRTVSFCVRESVGAGGICLITGMPGIGKTFATREVLHSIFDDLSPDTVLREERFPRSPSAKRIAERLLFAVTGEQAIRRTEEAITRDLVDALKRPTVLFIDEAHLLTAHGMHYLRYLWDEPETRISIVLVGATGAFQLINRDQTLRSRIFAHAAIKPLTKNEVKSAAPQLHPIWRNTSETLLDQVNSRYAKGNFRAWVIFTRWADAFCREANITSVDQEVVDEVMLIVQSLKADEG